MNDLKYYGAGHSHPSQVPGRQVGGDQCAGAAESVARAIEEVPTRRRLATSAALFAVLAGLMFLVAIPQVQRTCNAVPPDLQPFYDSSAVAGFLTSCGAEGTAAYARMQVVDLFYPAAAGALLFLALAALLRAWSGGGRVMLLALVPVISAAADYTENLMAWLLLAGAGGSVAGDIMGVAALVKTATGWASWLLLIALAVALAVRRAGSAIKSRVRAS